MTTYNCRIYTIDDIVFTMSPKNEFTLQDGKKTSYAKYLLDNYKIKLQYTDDQPLIKSILRKGRPNESVIYLVPETCVLTGITDEQKGKNFRDIKDDMFANAERKQLQAQGFFAAIKRDKAKYKLISDKYKIKVEESPVVLDAYKCKTCKVIGNDKQEVDLKIL